ncbi:MAG: nitrogen fixation protein NifQ [Chromatiaceae bacterium]|nr:MAG: nitrogen fixation protein NifQ [Chromatiaceae bacterium]
MHVPESPPSTAGAAGYAAAGPVRPTPGIALTITDRRTTDLRDHQSTRQTGQRSEDGRRLEPKRLYRLLHGHAAGHGNDHAFACMITSLCTGGGALPDWLGLEPAAFACLLRYHFPRLDLGRLPVVGRSADLQRADEIIELVALMLRDKAGDSPSEVWMAHVVAAGCLASDHLWQDLGLWERPELTALMRRNFPALAARNVKDMKWKRFLYKQLCEAEGIYTCRVPSCEVCTDYHACFGPEN